MKFSLKDLRSFDWLLFILSIVLLLGSVVFVNVMQKGEISALTEQNAALFSENEALKNSVTSYSEANTFLTDSLLSEKAEKDLLAVHLDEAKEGLLYYQGVVELIRSDYDWDFTYDEMVLLCRTVQLEAGDPYKHTEGQMKVCRVILNRVLHPNFPDTLEEVIYQENQFSILDKLDTCVVDAGTVLNVYQVLAGTFDGDLPPYVCFFFSEALKDNDTWITRQPRYETCDGHIFVYREKDKYD